MLPKLITDFREIRVGTLYILTDGNYPNGDNVFLFLPSLRPKPVKMNKELMQEDLDWQKDRLERMRETGLKFGIRFYECNVKLYENIMENFIDGQDYDNYEYLNFRVRNSLSPSFNNLCIPDKKSVLNKWLPPTFSANLDFNKPLFE